MSTSAHRVLAMDELVRLILEYFHLEPPRAHDTLPCISEFSLTEDDLISCKTLASCAQVCKSLSEPALDVLWHDLRDFSRILYLLPSSLKSVKSWSPYTVGCQAVKVKNSLTDPIRPAEWARLKYYAKRVKNLRYDRNGLDSSVLELLRNYCNDEPLFPNLQEFQWQQHPSYLQSELSLFVSSSLRSFTFSSPRFNGGLPCVVAAPSAHHSEQFIEMLRRKAPGLRNLLLSNVILSSGAVKMCGDFPNLLNLRLTDTIKPAEFVGSLSLVSLASNFQKLDTDVNLLPEEMRYPELGRTCKVVLPALKSLTLRGDAESIKNVLLQLTAPEVYTVGIVERRPYDESSNTLPAIMPCIEAVASLFKKLTCFRLVSLGGVQTQSQPLPQILEPLSKVKALQECRVYLYRENLWSLRDAEFVKMCKPWPDLRVLHLEGWPTLPSQPHGLTLNSLATISKHCPKLTSLRVPIVGGELSETDKIVPSPNLKTFAVSLPDEFYVDVLALATYVNRFAPNLDIKASQRFLEFANEAEPRKLLYKRLFRVLSLLQGADDPMDFVRVMEELVLDSV